MKPKSDEVEQSRDMVRLYKNYLSYSLTYCNDLNDFFNFNS